MRKILLLVLPVLAALAGVVLHEGPATPSSPSATTSLVEALLRRCEVVGLPAGEEPARSPLTCLGEGMGFVVTSQGVVPVVDELLGWYERDPMESVHCHTMMHLVGSFLEPSPGSSPYPLGDRWGVCGSGLIHGAFETLDLPGSPSPAAGEEAVRACAEQEFSSDETLLLDCAHSVGHSVFASYAGDVTEGERVCSGAAAAPSSYGAGALVAQCLGGLYMDDAERLLASRDGAVPDSVDGWHEGFDRCRTAADRLECATSFSRYAASSPVSAVSFLSWCSEVAEQEGCFRHVSRDLGTKTTLSGDRLFFDTCVAMSDAAGVPETPCVDGLLAAYRIAGQGGDSELVCALMKEHGSTCS